MKHGHQPNELERSYGQGFFFRIIRLKSIILCHFILKTVSFVCFFFKLFRWKHIFDDIFLTFSSFNLDRAIFFFHRYIELNSGEKQRSNYTNS